MPHARSTKILELANWFENPRFHILTKVFEFKKISGLFLEQCDFFREKITFPKGSPHLVFSVLQIMKKPFQTKGSPFGFFGTVRLLKKITFRKRVPFWFFDIFRNGIDFLSPRSFLKFKFP